MITQNTIATFSVCISISSLLGQTLSTTDGQILEAIESGLRYDEIVPADMVDVEVDAGVVTLAGDTFTLLQKRQTVRVVESLRGVRSIISRLKVRPSNRSDDDLEQDVVAALNSDAVADRNELNVSVLNGNVTLRGEVDSFAETSLADAAVAGVRGVVEVDNQLSVQPKEKRPDSEVKPEILRRFELSPYLAEGMIDVIVKDGFVSLSGEVRSLGEKKLAALLCWVSGVRSVSNSDVIVNSALAASERRRKFGVARNDLELQKAVQDTLLYDPRVLGSQITVRSQLGSVSLFGRVNTFAAKRAAGQDAKNTVGVRRVINHLKVKVPDWPGDAAVTNLVREALSRDAHLSDANVRASSHFGKVYLSGEVETYFEKDRAAVVAANVPVTLDVVNRLKVDKIWQSKPDSDIQEDIQRRLRMSPYLEAEKIITTVDGGVVKLNGTVDSWHERDEAIRHANQSGAKSVKDHLDVRASRSTPTGLKATIVVGESRYKLADSHSGKKFRDLVEVLKLRGGDTSLLPAAPEVDLTLRLANTTDQPLVIRFGHDKGGVEMSLTGPGAVHVPLRQAFRADFNTGSVVTVAPGKSVDLPIPSLQFGFRNESERWYWTEPGKHSLQISYTWPTDVSGFSMNSVAATPVELVVE